MGLIRTLFALWIVSMFGNLTLAEGVRGVESDDDIEVLLNLSDLIVVGEFVPLKTRRLGDMPVKVRTTLKGRLSTNSVVATFTKTELTLFTGPGEEWIIFMAPPFKSKGGKEFRRLSIGPYDRYGLLLATKVNLERVRTIQAKVSKQPSDTR